MGISKRERNKLESRKRIRAAYVKLCRDKNPETVTIMQLCEEAGLAKSTFYTYYEDKYEILDEIREELLISLKDMIHDLREVDMSQVNEGIPLEKALNALDYIEFHMEEFKTVLGPCGDPRFEIQWKHDIEDSFAPRFRSEKKNRRDAEIACTIFSSALIGLYKYYIFKTPHLNKRKFAIILGNTLKYSLYDFQAFAE